MSTLQRQGARWARLVADAFGQYGRCDAAAHAFAWSEPPLRLHLLGVRIDANVLQGIWQMTAQGDPLTAAMVLFCAVVAPVLLVVLD